MPNIKERRNASPFIPSLFFGYIMDNNKVPLILLSGGLDSSFLLQEKLKKGDVEILYVMGVLGKEKMHEERERRELIIKILEKDTGNRVRNSHCIDLGVTPFGDMADRVLTQPSMWMVGALMVSDSRIHSELCIGYVLGDHISSSLGHVTNAWSALQSFSKSNANIEVTFPLMHTTKDDILRLIHPEVVRHIWYCEEPSKWLRTRPGLPNLKHTKTRPCGVCTSCLTMGSALFRWNKVTRAPYWKHLRKQLKINSLYSNNKDSQPTVQIPESEKETFTDFVEIMDKHNGLPQNSNT